jgi:hypothetical protein
VHGPHDLHETDAARTCVGTAIARRYARAMAEQATPVRSRPVLGAAPTTGIPVMPIVLVFLALVVVSLLSFPSAGGARSEPVHLLTSVLTPDVADGYSISERSGVITAAAPTQNVGSNLRVLFWSSDAPVGTEGLSCSTWATATSPQVQQGAALRIGDEGGRVRAVVVTKNVALDAYWVFNVHVWDSITNELRPVGSVDLTGAFAVAGDPEVPRPLPWRMCARTEGPAVRLKVWLRSEPEPAWDDPTHAGVVALPADAPTDGVSGWYVGHLHPGMRATFTELADDPAAGTAQLDRSAR